MEFGSRSLQTPLLTKKAFSTVSMTLKLGGKSLFFAAFVILAALIAWFMWPSIQMHRWPHICQLTRCS
jgi:hypothetical protein